MSRTEKVLLAVDTPSLLHRNHHARKGSGLRDLQGQPVWALNGMLRQALEAISRVQADMVVFGFDDRRASVRSLRYPAYKAGRAEKDDDLVAQLDRAEKMLTAIGFRTVTPEGLEADDVTASAAHWAGDNGWRCVIVTSDRDSFGHISEHTSVLRVINGGIDGSPMLTPARLWTLYGIAPERYLEFAALRGDKSDNLPGLDGIGEATAPILLSEMGSMAAAWADIDHCGGATLVATLDSWAEEHGRRRIGGSVLKRLMAASARERFEFNLEIMSARTDLPLGLTPDVPDAPGVLPLDARRVTDVVDYLGVPSTTRIATEVLTGGQFLASPAMPAYLDLPAPPLDEPTWYGEHDGSSRHEPPTTTVVEETEPEPEPEPQLW